MKEKHSIDFHSQPSFLEMENEKIYGNVVGTLVGFDEPGIPLVDFPENPGTSPIAARSTLALSLQDIGREIVLVFERGDIQKPIVMGILQKFEDNGSCVLTQPEKTNKNHFEIEIDGEKVLLRGKKEVSLHCGEASITLTEAGKIIIRGTYILSRSSGANYIKGASVQIN